MTDLNASEAAKRLFLTYGDEIFQHVHLTIGNVADTEDLVQEIFLRVFRSWGKFQHRSSERTWLWAITRNCLKQFYRTKKRHPRQSIETTNRELEDKSNSDPIVQLVLEEGLQKLPLPLRQVFILRVLQDKTSSETAELLGWSEAKVRVSLYRATKKLRQFLSTQPEGGEQHGITGF